MIPETVEILAEARSRDEAKLEAQVDKMVKGFKEAATELGAEAEVKVTQMYPAYKFGESDAVVPKGGCRREKSGSSTEIIGQRRRQRCQRHRRSWHSHSQSGHRL